MKSYTVIMLLDGDEAGVTLYVGHVTGIDATEAVWAAWRHLEAEEPHVLDLIVLDGKQEDVLPRNSLMRAVLNDL